MDKPQLLFLLDGAGYRAVSGGSYEPGGGLPVCGPVSLACTPRLRLDPDTGLLVVILFFVLDPYRSWSSPQYSLPLPAGGAAEAPDFGAFDELAESFRKATAL